MSVIRVNKNKNYTIMSNKHFKDKRLSLKAKGLLSQMLSLPEDWDYTIAGLCAINKENVSAIKSTLNELKSAGYLVVIKKMPNETQSGRIEYIYDIYEQPIGKQEQEKQGIENLYVESQSVENHREYNTKQLKTNNQERNNIYNREFENLWDEYPRKQGKAQALKAYIKARQSGAEFEKVQDGIKAYVNYIKSEKIEPKYIKQGSTWFNQQCWNDEFKTKARTSSYDISVLEEIK